MKIPSNIKEISLGNWMLIGMILGFIVGLILNFYVSDPFIKDTILANNIFYLGGNVFIKLMKMLVVPLVFFSIVVGVASISDIKKIGTIGGRTIVIYLMTTVLAVTISLIIASVIQPGAGLNMASVPTDISSNTTITETILDMIPDNPFYALANGDMLPVIIFGVLVGIILAKLRDETDVVNKFFTQGDRIMMEMTRVVMKFAPIGIFCLMARTFSTLGFDGLMPIAKYIGCVLLCLAIHAFIVYPSLLVAFTRLNPLNFFKKFASVQFFAFSSSSSNATIPLTMSKLSEMGVSEDISSFTIPLGATINMDGTAIMQGCAVMFAAQAYGIDLGTSALLTVIFTAVMSSIGTAAVPSVGIITLNMVFNSVGLPADAIGMIMGIDHVLDMFRSAVNVTGDAICTLIVSFKNKSLDLGIYNGEKAPEETWDDITRF
ncbi:dicarboxylate/amino acid:cation symporter [Methanobrevibacter sp.]|uniref:dicarboxylate/amino acid:cation symporter n=1 Tax=Methanobrevibacter sp. TaxID=66852 RepID=UPI003866A76F